MRTIKTVQNLLDYDLSLQDDEKILRQVAARYAVSLTDSVLKTMRGPADTDPVARQYVPQAAELVTRPEERFDPIGDQAHSPVPGIIHRYPDRVLLMPVAVCAVYCRFCFRREAVGPQQKALKPRELDTALDYLRNNKNIWEVILSGGDPLILAPDKLAALLDAIEAIEHVQVIRIHSRIPVAAPEKITALDAATLDRLFRRKKPVYLGIHVNHAQEISGDAIKAFDLLYKAGCILLSQTVLLRGINDSAEALEALFRRLVSLRVRPYYLHHPDLAPGTGHFRLSVEEGQKIMRALRGRVSGLCLPTYILDIPGGFGKVPVGPCYYYGDHDNGACITDYQGTTHNYPA